MLQRLIGEDIQILWRPGPDLGPVRADPTQIDQILTNLCVNARDALPGGGQIILETGNQVFTAEDCAALADGTPATPKVLAKAAALAQAVRTARA